MITPSTKPKPRGNSEGIHFGSETGHWKAMLVFFRISEPVMFLHRELIFRCYITYSMEAKTGIVKVRW